MANITPQQVLDALNTYYSESELQTLAFTLNISFEDLEGRNRAGKALALVQHSQRHGIYDRLVQQIAAERPQVNWDVPASISGAVSAKPPSNPANPPQTQSGVTYFIQGDMVGGDKIGNDKVGGDKINVGDITGSTGIAIGRGASAQVVMGSIPENKTEFSQQIQELRALLEQAIAAGEIQPEEGNTAMNDLQDVQDETGKQSPRNSRITRRLEDVAEIVNTAGKAGSAILKATPVIAGLIQAAKLIF